MVKKRKILGQKGLSSKAKAAKRTASGRAGKSSKEERRLEKIKARRHRQEPPTGQMWAEPAPSHLVAKLDQPKIKSKYQSYFEFADNDEKKDKKLEFQLTHDPVPPPGYMFVAVGDPVLTNMCKELSREKDAMIFIVSTSKNAEASKVSEHIYRTGYHFREVIVDEARDIIGETAIISNTLVAPGEVEPIPESQEEINKQADGALRDLFPRIPNTDRQQIIEHAFKKGGLFHGEPTVGLQKDLSLSRRVQLAALAHIRHTHTRYDKLLRETTWVNARKVVEPVCLDVLVKWRGDEETGRDQMDEILREVVIIDSDESDDSSDEDSSEEDGEVSSISSAELISIGQAKGITFNGQAVIHNDLISGHAEQLPSDAAISSRTRAKDANSKKGQRGFSRYQAAWESARHRQGASAHGSGALQSGTPVEDSMSRRHRPAVVSTFHPNEHRSIHEPLMTHSAHGRNDLTRHIDTTVMMRPEPYYSPYRPVAESSKYRSEVVVRSPRAERHVQYENVPLRRGTPGLIRDRPPQVVRGSPIKRGPQDFPLPSIEPASPLADERHGDFNHPQDSYPRRVVEHRLQSPQPRHVIVIDDESPPVKRRRLVRADDSGQFRPLPSRDYDFRVSAAPSDSHFIPTSSAEAGDFVARRSRVPTHSSQGLYREVQETYTDPITAERLPVYNAPASGHFPSHPGYPRRVDRPIAGQRAEGYDMRQMSMLQPPRVDSSDGLYQQRPGSYMEAPDGSDYHGKRSLRQLSHEHSYPSGARPHGMAHMGPDHDFTQSFSRLDGPMARPRNGFTVASERSHSNFASRGNPQDVNQSAAAPFVPGPPARARSPVRYLERPIRFIEQPPRQPGHSNVPQQQQAPSAAPMAQGWAPPLQPPPRQGYESQYSHHYEQGRQVIVLE